jgi:hypothetical protein
MMARSVSARNMERALWHTQRHFGRAAVNFPAGSARAWLSDSENVVPERLALSNARRVVVKVGTAVVSNPDGTLALSRLGALVEQVASWISPPTVPAVDIVRLGTGDG